MVTLLALSAAIAYGVADFMGGAASRRLAVLRVLLISFPAGIVCLVAASLAAGFDEHFTKPVAPQQLIALLRKVPEVPETPAAP